MVLYNKYYSRVVVVIVGVGPDAGLLYVNDPKPTFNKSLLNTNVVLLGMWGTIYSLIFIPPLWYGSSLTAIWQNA